MKISNPANYYVRVWPEGSEEEPDLAALLAGIMRLSVNFGPRIFFVPDVSTVAPPWPPMSTEKPTTVEEARLAWATTSDWVVTPNAAHAGEIDRSGVSTIFYVTPDDFAILTADLEALAAFTNTSLPSWRHDDLTGHAVIRFLDDRVLPVIQQASEDDQP